MYSTPFNVLPQHLNFFRVHLVLFIVVPLLASLIFYWLNDARTDNESFVSYIDSFFLCISAATVAGLFPVVLSNLEVGQQIILAVLTAIGSYSFVSTALVLIRRHYFFKKMRVAYSGKNKAPIPGIANVPGEKGEMPSNKSSTLQTKDFVDDSPPDQASELPSGHTALTSPTSVQFQTRASGRHQSLASTQLARRRPTGPQSPYVMSNDRAHVKMYRTDTKATFMDRGYGGWPAPQVLIRNVIRRCTRREGKVPLVKTLTNKLTVPRTQTLQSIYNPDQTAGLHVRIVPYLTFNARVGKNSAFEDLTDDELEELGGLELKALNLLAWAVPLYWLASQALGFAILAGYMQRSEFRAGLTTLDGQAAPVNFAWFSLFQVISSYANNGILVDASLVPFQTAYLLLWVMIILILMGNTAFPCFLRFFLWLASQCVRRSSNTYATLRFILDHPRRCFLYLFPSTQTWYLVAILIFLNVGDWVLFLLLDIGNPPIQTIPPGVRVMAGLFQAVAVRCGGFQIVSLSTLAPAVQVLYVVMMYVGALPIALGVRSTNVYEDRSIALYEQEMDENEPDDMVLRNKARAWGYYMTWHLKRQISFDLWWLALAVFLICVFERGKLLDPDKSSFVNVFAIIFEVVSAYGTVGLSLGVPNENFSLSGVLGTASKLVLCAVMLRGRHRGLPAAIDPSVLLPAEAQRQQMMEVEYRGHQEAARSALHAAIRSEGVQDNAGAHDDMDVPPGLA